MRFVKRVHKLCVSSIAPSEATDVNILLTRVTKAYFSSRNAPTCRSNEKDREDEVRMKNYSKT